MINDKNLDNGLAEFLGQKRALNNNVTDSIPFRTPERLTSEENASIDDFILMLSKVCKKVMKKMNVELRPDEGVRLRVDQTESIDHPYIFFTITHCQPVKELKPRIRQDAVDLAIKNEEEELLQPRDIWGQLLRYSIQFNIFAGGYNEVTEVMKIFEDIIFSYTAYFKRKGVKDIRFLRRITDTNFDLYRQKCSVRSLQYDVDIEKLFTRFETTIGDITVR
jgi:hypothetical protein